MYILYIQFWYWMISSSNLSKKNLKYLFTLLWQANLIKITNLVCQILILTSLTSHNRLHTKLFHLCKWSGIIPLNLYKGIKWNNLSLFYIGRKRKKKQFEHASKSIKSICRTGINSTKWQRLVREKFLSLNNEMIYT